LAVARRRFVADGYKKTPVSAIVREAGVAQGTFYLYFPNKQAVLAELRREVFRDYARTLREAAALPEPADERLARVVVGMTEAVARNLDLERVFRHAESAEETLEAAREGRARLAAAALSFIEDGVQQGVFAGPASVRIAGFVVTLFDNILYEALGFEPEAVGEVVADSLRFVLRGMGVASQRVEQLVTAHAWPPASSPSTRVPESA
jgi:AcrR family transcriptional regulator